MIKLMHQVLETTTIDNTVNYILILANATGMRIGEILGLTFDDIDIANQVISIRQSYDYVLTHKAKATKTESSVRQVKVDKVTYSYLAEIVDDRPSLCRTSNKNHHSRIQAHAY